MANETQKVGNQRRAVIGRRISGGASSSPVVSPALGTTSAPTPVASVSSAPQAPAYEPAHAASGNSMTSTTDVHSSPRQMAATAPASDAIGNGSDGFGRAGVQMEFFSQREERTAGSITNGLGGMPTAGQGLGGARPAGSPSLLNHSTGGPTLGGYPSGSYGGTQSSLGGEELGGATHLNQPGGASGLTSSLGKQGELAKMAFQTLPSSDSMPKAAVETPVYQQAGPTQMKQDEAAPVFVEAVETKNAIPVPSQNAYAHVAQEVPKATPVAEPVYESAGQSTPVPEAYQPSPVISEMTPPPAPVQQETFTDVPNTAASSQPVSTPDQMISESPVATQPMTRTEREGELPPPSPTPHLTRPVVQREEVKNNSNQTIGAYMASKDSSDDDLYALLNGMGKESNLEKRKTLKELGSGLLSRVKRQKDS